MTLPSSFGAMVRAAWVAMAMLCALAAQANINVGTSANPVITGYAAPYYVIDSDVSVTTGGYERHEIPLSVAFSFSLASINNTSRNYRVVFRLYDNSTGEPVSMRIVVGGIPFSTTSLTTPAQTVSLSLLNSSTTRTFSVDARPTVQLDPHRTYRVEARLQESPTTTNSYTDKTTVTSTALYTLLHFRGSRTPDNALNVISVLNSATVSRRYMVETDPARDEFEATVAFTLHRYDDPTESQFVGNANVPVRFEFELLSRSATGNFSVIPLEASTLTPEEASPSMLPFTYSNVSPFQRPVMVNNISRTLRFRLPPGAQLDSYNFTYGIRVRIVHQDVAGIPGIWKSGNLVTTTTPNFIRMFQFSGNLQFGNVPTRLSSVTGVTHASFLQIIPDQVQVPITIGSSGGEVLSTPGYRFGPATVTVRLLPNGDAVIAPGSSVPLFAQVNPDESVSGGVAYERGNLTLGTSGASASGVIVKLPQGMSYSFARTDLNHTHELTIPGPVPLLPDMGLPELSYIFTPPLGQRFFVAEESKPLVIECTQMVWDRLNDRFVLTPLAATAVHYVRKSEAAIVSLISGLPGIKNETAKLSNSRIWELLSRVQTSPAPYVSPGDEGQALMTASFVLQSGSGNGVPMNFHFPHRAFIVPIGGQVVVEADLINNTQSWVDLDPSWPTVDIAGSTDCVEPSCSSGPGNIDGLRLRINPARLVMTAEGGLVGAGELTSPYAPRWGYIPAMDAHAHRFNSEFTEGEAYLPGIFIRGDMNSAPEYDQPGIILLSGATRSGSISERPSGSLRQTEAYWISGFANYAGLNLRVPVAPEGEEMRVTSLLGGGAYNYRIKSRSKFYLRRGGISGILDKVTGSPETVFINGYNFTLRHFGLSFLSNNNIDSRTEGSLALPNPTDFTLAFERLRFLCNGALDQADIAGGLQTVTARYWASEWDVASMDFVRNDSVACTPGAAGAANLVLGVTAYAAHVRDPIEGRIGVFPNGNLIAKAANVDGVDSRLIGPSQVSIRGPRRAAAGSSGFETYYFTPTTGFYFNVVAANFGPTGVPAGVPPVGFVNVAGRMRVSFFEALQAHLQMASVRPPASENESGEWGSVPLYVMNGKWSGGSFFGSGFHDASNRGFPGNSQTELTTYRTAEDFALRAHQDWLNGAISFDFPVQWNTATRSLRSSRPIEEDFVVLTTERRVAYLSAERAEVRFGAQAGLPQLNLSNLVINTLGDATGIAATVQNAFGNTPVLSQLNAGLESAGSLLSNNPSAYFEQLLGAQLNAASAAVYNQLLAQWGTSSWTGDYNQVLQQYFNNNVGSSTAFSSVWTRLQPASQTALLQQKLQQYITGIEAFTGPQGLLRPDGPGATALVLELVRLLIQDLAGELAGNIAAVVGEATAGELNQLIGPYLAEFEPSLRDLRTGLEELRLALVDVRNRLNFGNDFFQLLSELESTARTGEFPNFHSQIRDELSSYLGSFNSSNRFPMISRAQVESRIRKAMLNRLISSTYAGELQSAFRGRLFEINAGVQSSLNSSFSVVNDIIRGSLTGILTEVDTAFAEVLGPFSAAMAMAGVDGHAIFEGDSLRQIRLDARVRWALPNPSTFTAFLEVNQYEAGSNQSVCTPAGSDAAVVTLGANNVPFDFLGPDMRIDVTTQFSFAINGGKMDPIGFAGALKMASGSAKFEAFEVTELAVAVAFGQIENYLSAGLGLKFNGFKAKGGVFFGRTCTIQPIMQWDLFVAQALGNPQPTFTGIYVYGEAHIPVMQVMLGIPATCVFQVTAGMGLGIFVFAEGPTYGARGLLEVSGEALCVFNIGGRVDFVGMKQGNKFKLRGQGSFYMEIGLCPFCFKGYKTISMSSETGGGKAKGRKPTSN